MVSRRSGLKPGLTEVNRKKLLSIRPEPSSNINDRATSTATSTLRKALRLLPAVEDRLDSCIADVSAVREDENAGTSPTRIPVTNAIPIVNHNTLPLTRIVSILGMEPAILISASVAQPARTRPSAAPAVEK